MNYFLSEAGELLNDKTAMSKPRSDTQVTLKEMGFREIITKTYPTEKKLMKNINKYRDLLNETRALEAGDILVIQHPSYRYNMFIYSFLKKMKERKVRTIALVHDLDFLRKGEKLSRSTLSDFYLDKKVLKAYDSIIVHNDEMKKKLLSWGFTPSKLVSLKIFDYRLESDLFMEEKVSNGFSVVSIAGNLLPNKAGYVYNLPKEPEFYLYGVNYNEELQNNSDNVSYKGVFQPDDISKLKGKYGLVWDGESIDTCSGDYGNYLRFNNSFKASMYLAAGIPVIVWNESAMSSFIKENGCGITVDKLTNLEKVLNNISDVEYQRMKDKCHDISSKIRAGFYLKNAISKCMK